MEAGQLLAHELHEFEGSSPVVLGIPRGGVVVAREISRALGGDLDVVLAHKLGTPGNRELAMGAVAEDGSLFLNENVTSMIPISPQYVEAERLRQLAEIKRRAELIRRVRPKVGLKDRVVIITDDGVATGSTTQAAIWAVKTEQPARVVVAIPVGPEETILRLGESVDLMVCLKTPPAFAAVGQFYRHFYPIEDEDMLRILEEELHRRSNPAMEERSET